MGIRLCRLWGEISGKEKGEYPCESRAHRQGDEEGHQKWSLPVRLLRGDIPVIQEQIHARQKQTRGRPVEEESSMKTSVD